MYKEMQNLENYVQAFIMPSQLRKQPTFLFASDCSCNARCGCQTYCVCNSRCSCNTQRLFS